MSAAGPVLVLVDHDRGAVAPGTLEALTLARGLTGPAGGPAAEMAAVVPAADALWEAHGSSIVAECAAFGATVVHQLADDLLADYGPQAWAEALDAALDRLAPQAVVGPGTDRGAEVMAHLAAFRSLALVANCVRVTPPPAAGGDWQITRRQWGGSLLEDVTLGSELPLLTVGLHAVEARPLDDGAADGAAGTADGIADGAAAGDRIEVDLSEAAAATLVADRVVLAEGVTLATAPVVVSGGRGVGSAEGFAALEELAGLLGGRVGCSRAVTNNGWRSHADQVGQTGTRIAPELYIACGISGAIQHWVGAMGSKNILAVNIDPEANMVAKAGYAVIADLHEVVPAVCEEIRRRRDTA
ncbi:MAG TPA: electron transfer flavoprotein subunit alpha/FixB family protein [Acidimicrobiaceae bacterium]|nr:electron transfer flavoprotein subunit alpha/FixB family protein [Acidimicrobiaceae bacterium]